MPLAEAGEADDAPRGGLPSLLPSSLSPRFLSLHLLEALTSIQSPSYSFLLPPGDPAQSPAGSPPRCLRFLFSLLSPSYLCDLPFDL